MTLLFQRLARNFIANGYFPTDAETTERVLALLTPSPHGTLRIIDPCAGEGVALAECKNALSTETGSVESFAVEYHAERAAQAKQLSDRCIHGDFQETVISARAFGLLWLNPPYGDLVADQAKGAGGISTGRQRLEKLFFQQAARLLQFGGILVLIVPHYTLDKEFRAWLSAGFERVQVFLAPEQQFQQAVVIGVRKRSSSQDATSQQVLQTLEAFCAAEAKPELPKNGQAPRYTVPASQGQVKFHSAKWDAPQLANEIARFPGLWGQFHMMMQPDHAPQRAPLMPLSDWHLALALAAGQVSGVIHSREGGKTYVIKGDTVKHKKHTVQMEEYGEGEQREIRVAIDVFVPTIKALDFTPNSPTFGQVLTIR